MTAAQPAPAKLSALPPTVMVRAASSPWVRSTSPGSDPWDPLRREHADRLRPVRDARHRLLGLRRHGAAAHARAETRDRRGRGPGAARPRGCPAGRPPAAPGAPAAGILTVGRSAFAARLAASPWPAALARGDAPRDPRSPETPEPQPRNPRGQRGLRAAEP